MEISKVIETFIKDEVANGHEPILYNFVEAHREFIVENKQDHPSVFWSGMFSRIAKKLEIPLGRSNRKIQWNKILNAAEEEHGSHGSTEETTSSKRTRSSGSKSDSHPLTEAMIIQYTNTFNAMKDTEKWRLDDGVYVEDLIYKHGLRSSHEHPAHSFILDVDDGCWNDIISPAQMKAIIAAGLPALPNYNQNAKSMIDALSSVVKKTRASQPSLPSDSTVEEKKLVDAVWKKVVGYGFFDPYKQFDENWVQRTILDILDMYRWGVLSWVGDHGSEMDFVARIWVLLDKAFDDLRIETRRDQTSVATVLSNNQDRGVTGFAPVDAKLPSIRPDLILYRNDTEYGASECGKEHEIGISKKKIVESELHLPKTLKMMFNHAVSRGDNNTSLIRSLRAVGFQQFHLGMRVSVMDSPEGYVCRMRTTPQYELSPQPSLMSFGVLQILRLTLKVKEAVRISIEAVEDQMAANDDKEPDVACVLTNPSELILPPVAKSGEKKQKTINS